jgi:hypothetical protein
MSHPEKTLSRGEEYSKIVYKRSKKRDHQEYREIIQFVEVWMVERVKAMGPKTLHKEI